MPATLENPQSARSTEAPRAIHRSVRGDGVCVLTFDRHGSSANLFDRATLAELQAEVDFIESNCDATPPIKGVIVVSAKRSIFMAGLDLKTIGENPSTTEVREIVELGQSVFTRIAALKIPTAAAIHGAALGGGFEMALACDLRLASPDGATKVGLPETQLGLLPAWGGATRLPRLIGLPRALELVLSGKIVGAKRALKLGIVDALVPAEHLIEAAAKMQQQGKPHRSGHWLVNDPLAAAVITMRMRKQILKKTRGHYPAVLAAFEVMTRGIGKSIPGSLALERNGILELIQTGACRNLIRLFSLQEHAKKLSVTDHEPKPVARVAVIGAGAMGAGIAQWLSARRLPVILRDVNAEQLAKGLGSIAKIYRDGVKRQVFTRREARDGMDRIFPAPQETPLCNVDLVIEAAVENLELKKQVFQRLDELTGDETILATNTSALPVSELAAATRRPERVAGLHFFNPVHRMQLVEVIAARQTEPEVLQRAVKFVQQAGKLPVVVKDSPGFLVNRILMPYLIEAGNLFESGAEVATLDETMLEFGMPMGPMRLLDEVGLDVALHVAESLAAAYRDRMKVPGCLRQMISAGLLGRKNGRGFYLHDKSSEARLNPEASRFVQNQAARGLPREELPERMVLLMINEAARCLEEQIVAGPQDVDFAMVMGTGFAPFRGGPLRYADSLGLDVVVGAMENLVDRGVAYFEPCALLRKLTADRSRFHTNK